MTRDQLLRRLDTAWRAFTESYAGLPADRLIEPGVAGEWSVKDVIAHVSTWEEEALTHLPAILAGEQPARYADAYGGLNAFNALRAGQKRELSLAEVLDQAAATHARLIAYIETIPEEQFTRETRVRRRLRLDTYSHYPEHTAAILAWRAGLPAA